MAKATVLLAEGFEEIEAITPVDVLRRAGVDVTTVAVGSTTEVTGSHGVTVRADRLLDEIGEATPDAVVLPGGLPGAENLAASDAVGRLIETVHGQGGIVAAICASPAYVLAPLGLLSGRKATCYPGAQEGRFGEDVTYVDGFVVRDGNIITAQGPAAAMEFALAVAEALVGRDTAAETAARMLVGKQG